jgi:apolipoprotein D and lipocalin family protein
MPYCFLLILLLSGCGQIADGLTPINQFQLQRYLGTWYEIARLDHRFERGLVDVKADYSLRDDGGVRVLNSGTNSSSGQRETAEGRAYFVSTPDIGQLKVSFFGPFFGGYNIIALDKSDYRYALIAGPTRDYLWILARTPQLEAPVLDALVAQAKAQGFNTDALIYDRHN